MSGASRSVYVAAVLAAFGIIWGSGGVRAGEADVLHVEVRTDGPGHFLFAATVRHDDQGWDHYADAFEIVGSDGQIFGTRVLGHPHVDEQPFTRMVMGVAIPDGVRVVTVRAHDTVHGLGGEAFSVPLPGR